MGLADNVPDLWQRATEGSACLKHIVDPFLRQLVQGQVTRLACTACGRAELNGPPFAVAVKDLVDVIREVVDYYYEDANNEAPWDSSEGGWQITTYDTWEVVENLCSDAFVPEHVDHLLAAITDGVGTETTWVESGPYDSNYIDYTWDQFVETVHQSARFVILQAEGDDNDNRRRSLEPPHRLGAFLRLLLDYVDSDTNLVRTLPPGTILYRGRLTDNPRRFLANKVDSSSPARRLGPAPAVRAAANRMSPAGISMFYASADPETAIAEIATHGPEPYAVIGGFRSTRALTVLDFTADDVELPSVFDAARRKEAAMARFRRSLVESITAPIIPDGRQHVEYTPTQVITEYLRWAPETQIHGIALPSAQSTSGAKTFVLFFNANDCADSDESAEAQNSAGTFTSVLPENRPTFLLSVADVKIYEITRRYEAKPI